MALNDIIVPKENATGDFDEVALAAGDIGAAAAQVLSSQFISGDTLLSAGRNRRIALSVVATSNVDLPYENNANGDVVTLVQGQTGVLTATIRAAETISGGVPIAYSTLATLTTVGQSFTFVSNGTATGWSLRAVDTHTQPASTITGLPEASTTTPAALGTAAVGTGTTFARADHVHAMPTAANVGAAKAVTEIELNYPPSSTTITTAQLPVRAIAFAPSGETTFTVNLPTPDVRQSGLTFSVKTELEEGIGIAFITVVHNAVNLLDGWELDEAEGSIDFLWDGYRWVYDSSSLLRSYPNRRLILPGSSGTLALTESADNVFRVVGSADPTKKLAFEVDGLDAATTRTLTVPNSSGTIALNETFAAPPSIGNTTPAAGSFTTLNATGTTELVNGASAAGPFLMYRSYTNVSNYERGKFSWESNILRIGTEKLGTGTARPLEFQTDGVTRMTIAANGQITASGDLLVTSSATWATGQTANIYFGAAVSSSRLSVPFSGHANWNNYNGIAFANNSGTPLVVGAVTGVGGNSTVALGGNITSVSTYAGASLVITTATATFKDAMDIAVGTTTGTKIGTATTQKIGFFNATPVVQQAAVADATDAASTQARLNDLLARLRTLGLIAT